VKESLITVIVLIVVAEIGMAVGALAIPRHVVVTVEKPGAPQIHTVYVRTDSGPYPVVRDTVWLHDQGIPIPPIPVEPQPQMIYGLSFTHRNLSLSIRQQNKDSLWYRQEVWTGIMPNFAVHWDTVDGQWNVATWPDSQTTIVPTPAKRSLRQAWRPTVSGGLTWYPGSEVVATVEPGLLLLGHLKVGAVGQLSLAKLRAQQWSSTRVGLTAELVW